MEVALLSSIPSFLWNYHRSNYLYDERIVQNSELLHYAFQVQLYGQFRADIRSFWTITKLKLTNMQVLSTIEMGLSLALYTVGRPKPDEYINHYVLGLFTGSVAASMGFLLLSLWFSTQCMLASHADNLTLLLNETRLPIPTAGLLNSLVARADKFEVSGKNKAYRRLPFVEKLPLRRGSQYSMSDTLRHMLFDPQTAPRFPCTGNASGLHHVQAFRTLQAYWINYDAYSRICMSIGSLAFFRTMAFFCTFAIHRHASLASGTICVLLMVVTAVVIIYIDLQSMSFKTLQTAVLFSFSPLIILFMSLNESALGSRNQLKNNIILNVAGGCAFLAEAAWYTWIWFLCTPDDSGLPSRYRTAVMFLNILDNKGIGRPKRDQSPGTSECAARAERAAADGLESPAMQKNARHTSSMATRPQAVHEAAPGSPDRVGLRIPVERAEGSREPERGIFPKQLSSPCVTAVPATTRTTQLPTRRAKSCVSGQHAASVGFVNQKAPSVPNMQYGATPDERAKHYERLIARLHLLQHTLKHFPATYRADALPLVQRASGICKGARSCEVDWVGIDTDLDGYGSSSVYYVSSSAGVSWVVPAQYVMIQQLFADMKVDLDVVEQIRTPDSTKRVFEGAHAACTIEEDPWGKKFQHRILRTRFGHCIDVEATAKHVNGTFLHWKLLRINLAIIILAHLSYAIAGFTFFNSKYAEAYQDILLTNIVPIRRSEPVLSTSIPQTRRLQESVPRDKQVRISSDTFQWPYVPSDLRCQNGSVWHSNGLVAYRDHVSTAVFERERAGRVTLSDTAGFALQENGDTVRYERKNPRATWRPLARVPINHPAVGIAVVAPWTLIVATRNVVLRVCNDSITVVQSNRGKPWEQFCYDRGRVHLLGIKGTQWDIVTIRL